MARIDRGEGERFRIPVPALTASVALSVLAAAALAALLWHLLYRGIPHSYDPMTYSWSVWGVSHGDFFNPVVSAPVFGVHGQLVQLLLAPLVRLIAPAMVLVLAQAAALGATVFLAALAFARVATEGGDRSPGRAALLGAVLVTLGSPLVLNAFLFDVRPEMLGIPLIVAGLLRAERRGDLDGVAVALLLSSLAAREDYAILVAPALLLIPGRGGVSTRSRVAAAAFAVAYFGAYLLVVRRLLGGPELVRGFNTIAANMLDPAADSGRASTLAELLRFKGEILLVAAAGFGGFALKGGRWLLLPIPGLLFLLAQNRLQPWVLNTHYSIFAAPALVVAAVAGYRRWVGKGSPRPVATVSLALAAAAGCFLLSSAAPGGGRYLLKKFGWSALHPLRASGLPPVLVPIRRLLEAAPASDGLAVPYAFGPPLAGRRVVHALESLPSGMLAQGRVPAGVDWVGLMPPLWAGYGRALVEREGFVVHGLVPGSFALLSRERAGRIPAPDLAAAMPPESCPGPVASWPAAGIDLCGVRRLGEGRVVALVRRRGSAGEALRPLLALAPSGRAGEGAPVPLRILGGMLPLADLPEGVVCAAVSDRGVSSSSGRLLLLDPGRASPVPATRAGALGEFVEGVDLAWAPLPADGPR